MSRLTRSTDKLAEDVASGPQRMDSLQVAQDESFLRDSYDRCSSSFLTLFFSVSIMFMKSVDLLNPEI